MTVMNWRCELHGNVAVTSFIDDQRRDDHGEIFHAGYRSVETWLGESGNWRMIGSATIALTDDPHSIGLPVTTLQQYTGDYVGASGIKISLILVGPEIQASLNGGPALTQKAEVADVLFTPGHARTKKVFDRNPAGAVVGFFLRREGHDTYFKRADASRGPLMSSMQARGVDLPRP